MRIFTILSLGISLTLNGVLAVSSIGSFFAPVSAQQPDYSKMTPQERHKIALKTEVWEPIPEEITFDKNRVPSDAIVLFDGSGLDAFIGKNDKKPTWLVKDNTLTVVPKSGGIQTKESFCDVQIHAEWQAPAERSGPSGQQWGNSGLYIMGRYEIQIGQSYRNRTYSNGQAGAMYKQSAPLVNATTPVGEWQTFDIVFTAPRFFDDGKVKSPAYITALHNGVLVQNHFELKGPTVYVGKPEYRAHGCAPIFIQEHNDAVSFRNIWVRKL